MPKVFVYGTLKRGHGNNRFLKDEKFIGEVKTCDTFKMVNRGFPYLIEKGATSENDICLHVKGEMFEVSEADTLKNLDWLEGVEYNHYKRVVIDVFDEKNQVHEGVYAYVATEDTAEQALNLPESPVKDGGGVFYYEWSR
jgi:gamma-glutamylcyclotransferase (GGCT)/AIG2-like uncharacterized protein YtfP